jgi:hypothetical protein
MTDDAATPTTDRGPEPRAAGVYDDPTASMQQDNRDVAAMRRTRPSGLGLVFFGIAAVFICAVGFLLWLSGVVH